MSDQAIYIELQGTTSHVHPPDHPEIRFGIIPAIRDLMVRYSDFPIPHTEFGIRESGFGNPREHWPEPGSHNSSWCGIFPLTTRDMVR